MDTEGSTIKLNIICPDSSCGTQKDIMVPADNLKQSESGIVTISISKGLVCNHSFQVFVDMNGRVRGYKKPDFELSFAQDQEPDDTRDAAQYEEPDRILQGVQLILGDEMFYKTIRSALYNLPTYVITDIPSIHSMVDNFRKILEPYVDEFTICTVQEYNRDHRGQLAVSKEERSFVIAIDQRIIINQIYDGKYDERKFVCEKSMLAIVDPSRSNEETIQSLHTLFDNINKKLTLDFETVEAIITSRYDFDVDAYFKEKSRASEWGKGILDLTG
jgi:hypothetical protein